MRSEDATIGTPGWTVTLLPESAVLAGTGYADWGDTHDLDVPHLLRLLRRQFHPPPSFGQRTEYGLGFGFPTADIPGVLALLDSVRHQTLYQDYTAHEGSDTGAWSPPHIRHDQIRIYGPVISTGSREPWAPTASVELEYATVADLHSNLRTVADFAHHDLGADHENQQPDTRIPPGGDEWLHEQTRLARVKYTAARRAFDTTTAESRRLLDLGIRRRSDHRTSRTPEPTTDTEGPQRKRPDSSGRPP